MKAQAAKKDDKMQAFQWSMIWNDPSSGNNGNSAPGGPGNGNIFWDDPSKSQTALKPNARQQNGLTKTTEPRPFEANLVITKQKAVRLNVFLFIVLCQHCFNGQILIILFRFTICLNTIEHTISCR